MKKFLILIRINLIMKFFSLIDTFPKKTSKINEYDYAYYGKDGVLLSINVCDYLFTKTKDSFVETIHFCSMQLIKISALYM